MADAPNDTTFVDPNTDDLDAFNDLMTGRAKVQEEVTEPVKKEDGVETDDSDEVDTGETQEENDETDLDDEADLDEDGEDEEGTKQPEKPAKKVNRFQERINELTAKAREAERKLDEIMRKQSEPVKEDKPPVQPVQKDVGPTPDDTNEDGSDKYPLGEFDPQYIRDLTRHTIQAEQTAATERAEQERVERETAAAREQLQTQWVEKISTVTDKHPDFMEKTITLESTFDGLDPNYSDYLVQTIKSLDHGPEVLYHFANNLDEAQKFVKMGPLAATLALGEMNAKFRTDPSQQQAKPEPKVSSAPTPPPVNKGNKTRSTVAPDTDDLDAFSQAFFSPKRRR